MLTRRMALASAAALLATTALPAFAAEPEVYSKDGKAIGGYDPVAYFTQGGPARDGGFGCCGRGAHGCLRAGTFCWGVL